MLNLTAKVMFFLQSVKTFCIKKHSCRIFLESWRAKAAKLKSARQGEVGDFLFRGRRFDSQNLVRHTIFAALLSLL